MLKTDQPSAKRALQWTNIQCTNGDVHTVPIFQEEPDHLLHSRCWCGPELVRRINHYDHIVHTCLTQPDTNTNGYQVVVS